MGSVRSSGANHNRLIFIPHGGMTNTQWQHNKKVIMPLGHGGESWDKQ